MRCETPEYDIERFKRGPRLERFVSHAPQRPTFFVPILGMAAYTAARSQNF